MKRVQN